MPKKLKCWRKSNPRKDLIVFEKGKQIEGSPFNLAENAILVEQRRNFENKKEWEVRSNFTKINPQTIYGRVRFFKTKSQALKFSHSFMRKHDKC